jgi:hypothetical protein
MFTATLNPASQPVDDAPGGFAGTARMLFRSKLGCHAAAEFFTVARDAAGGLQGSPPDGHGPAPPPGGHSPRPLLHRGLQRLAAAAVGQRSGRGRC